MDTYQILTLIVSLLSITISLGAVIIAYLPYSKKIIFKVSLNPFTKLEEGFNIDFLIINKTNKDLNVESLSACKIISFQLFDDADFPHLIKANNSEMFSINSSKLKFDSFKLFEEDMVNEKEKNAKYIKFYILNSIRETITYKMRIKDYMNACKIFELYKKIKEDDGDLESRVKLFNEIIYFHEKNK